MWWARPSTRPPLGGLCVLLMTSPCGYSRLSSQRSLQNTSFSSPSTHPAEILDDCVNIWFSFVEMQCKQPPPPPPPPSLAPSTNAREGLSAGLEPPSAKLQAGKAKNTLNRKCLARQKEGSHCGNWWAPCHILSLPLSSTAPSAAHMT